VKEHIRQRHRPKKSKLFVCDTCGKCFTSHVGRLLHKRAYHASGNVVEEKERKEKKLELKCKLCDKTYASYPGLSIHKRTTHDIGIFPCTIGGCKETFEVKPKLERHIRKMHHAKLTCEVCGKLIAPGEAFTAHMKTHKTKICTVDGCGKTFNSATIYTHMKNAHKKQESA
jgi:Zinc finger, C2H2 type